MTNKEQEQSLLMLINNVILLVLSLFRFLLADVLLHAVVQDALHAKALHPGDRWSDPHCVLVLT